LNISGYVETQLLYESQNTIVYQAIDEKSRQKVILKTLKSGYITSQESNRLQTEYRTLEQFDNEGVIGVLGQTVIDNTPAIVMEDIGGRSLSDILTTVRLDLPNFLSLAYKITTILKAIHDREIIHKDINPSNIIWNQKEDLVRIIDFGISTQFSRESIPGKNPGVIEGTLYYISPEQTGRMNRVLDYRTDFYSLGITFYQMLTGQVPFNSDDLGSLIHSHIAKQPKSPVECDPAIPKTVSSIVMKLIAKNAEDRYNSTYGILADLERCQKELEDTGKILDFEPGLSDLSDHFSIPQKLYGRTGEIHTMMSTFERARNSCAELLLVSGESGTGKSLLINEIQRFVVEYNALYLEGSFEQLKTDIPYSGLIQAVSKLARQILAEDQEKLTAWKKSLMSFLEPNARIITDMFPLFEHILGEQPEVPDLPPVESQNRFDIVLRSFFRGIVQDGRPLVLFLDNLQWADRASLRLLMLVAADKESKSVLIIGSYRSEEKGNNPHLVAMFDSIKEQEAPLTAIELQPLERPDVMCLLSDTLHCTIEDTADFATLVQEKTGGNPLFISQFLNKLYTEKLIRFSFSEGWSWDMQGIRQMQVTDNIVDLMVSAYHNLSDQEREVLTITSCIGSEFGLDLVAAIGGFKEDQALTILDGLVKRGLLNRYDRLYHFSHHRIRESAYTLLSDSDRSNIHYRIGKYTLQNADHFGSNEGIFTVANHLNAGRENISDRAEQWELIELNRSAGLKALSTNAFASAYTYLAAGIRLLGTNCWDERYETALSLHTEATVAAQLKGDYNSMQTNADIVLDRAANVLETVRVHEALIFACAARNQLLGGVRAGLRALEQLGLRLPEKPGKTRILLELLSAKTRLLFKPIETLIDLDEVTDPTVLAKMRLLSACSSSVYVAAPDLLPLLIIIMVKLSVKYGTSVHSPYFYAAFGMLHCGVLNDADTGYKLGKLALDLMKKYGMRETRSRVGFLFWFFIHHWKRPMQEAFQPMLECRDFGLETGDLEYSAWNVNSCIELSIFAGAKLTSLEKEKARSIEFARQLNQDHVVSVALIDHQMLLDLTAPIRPKEFLSGTSFDKKMMIPEFIEENNTTGLFIAYTYLLQLRYLFGDYVEALEYAELVRPLCETQIAHMMLPSINMYDSLTRLAMCPGNTPSEKKKNLRIVSRNQRRLRRWADGSPSNYSHKYLLIEAERYKVAGQFLRSIACYREAFSAAEASGSTGEKALCFERLTALWYERGEKEVAASYFQMARNGYDAWGAHSKLVDLDSRFRDLAALTRRNSTASSIPSTTSYSGRSEMIDLATVQKTSQALSSAIELGTLLATILRFSIENAGAQRGFLIFENEEEGGLRVEAEISDEASVSVLESKPLSAVDDICIPVVQYVDRTSETIILHDAGKEGYFTSDPHIIRSGVKSLICAPISHKGKKTGILYLENNLAPDIFTQERMDLLKMVTSQAAISIENARLYGSLERKVQERTAQLEEVNRQLTELSLKDHLTKLRNRRYIYEFITDYSDQFIGTQKRLMSSLEKRDMHLLGKVLGIFLLDIDHFKSVNDTWGHNAGDKVLVAISNVLKSNIRDDDVLVRWGGEEFLIILTGSDPSYLPVLSKKILNAVAATPHDVTADTRIFKTCSIGCAKIPAVKDQPDLLNLDQVINLCDYALYSAKEQGRNRAIHLDIINSEGLDAGKQEYLASISKDSSLDASCISLEEIVP
jgi:diguanylate cyclase (GGDEF)-like protein